MSLAGSLRRQRQRCERTLENKDGEAEGRQARGDVTEKEDGDKLRSQTAVVAAAV